MPATAPQAPYLKLNVIPGLVPGIHGCDEKATVDGRNKSGHDDVIGVRQIGYDE